MSNSKPFSLLQGEKGNSGSVGPPGYPGKPVRVQLFTPVLVVSKQTLSTCLFFNRGHMEEMGKMEFQGGLDKRSALSKGLRG